MRYFSHGAASHRWFSGACQQLASDMAGLGGLASRFPRLSFASIIVRRVARCLPFMAWRWLVIQVVASMIFFTVLLSWNGLSISSSRATAPSGSGFYSAKRAELQSRHALRHREDNGTLQDDEHWIFYAKSLIAQVKARMRYWESTAGAFLFEPGWVDDDERIPLPPHAPHRLRCSECVGTPMFDYHKAFMAIVTDKLRFRCDVRRKEPLEHAQYLLTRKNERRVISLGLYGGDPRYVHGLYRNVELMTQILPFWRMRLYYDTASVPPAHAARFERMGYAARIRKAVLCVGRSVELVKMKAKTSTSTEGMFWRFLIADDTDVARFVECQDNGTSLAVCHAVATSCVIRTRAFRSGKRWPSTSGSFLVRRAPLLASQRFFVAVCRQEVPLYSGPPEPQPLSSERRNVGRHAQLPDRHWPED